MSAPVALAVTVALLAGNAFFVGAEFAVTSSRRSQLEPLAEAGDARAATALWALRHISRMLATAQLGVTVCSTGLGVVAEPAIAHALTPLLISLGIGRGGAHPVAVFGPVITVLNGFANRVLHLMGLETREEVSAAFNAAEVASIVERSTAEGVLEDDTGLLAGALEFSEETAGSVMVPLDALTTLPEDCTPEDVEQAVAVTGFSRFPLVAGGGHEAADADEDEDRRGGPRDSSCGSTAITGYLHFKDVLYTTGAQRGESVPAWHARALVPVHAGDEVESVLAAMQRTGAHLGRVEDVDGTTVGVVFLEDILEELVGEVNDAMQRG